MNTSDFNSVNVSEEVETIAKAAKAAQLQLANLNRAAKDAVLISMAEQIENDLPKIMAANQQDLDNADQTAIAPGLRDRLVLNEARIKQIVRQLQVTAALNDPIGEVLRGQRLENGLQIQQVRVPMGVIAMIYEARPNVTVDAASLAFKAGSAVILRGGSAAKHTNLALISSLHQALSEHGLPISLISSVNELGSEAVGALLRARGLIDLLIPRGGAGLIRKVVEESLVPVIETGTGNTHIFVDESADLAQALEIIVNAKTQRIGVCNALENLLVHRSIAKEFLPVLAARLAELEVTIHADQASLPWLENSGARVVEATDEDYFTEYLDLDLALKQVADVQAAIDHIRQHSSGHTESILTSSISSERSFLQQVDSAVVMVNASTRFSDGGEFGFGAEIGISTQKLHARGPMALAEITSSKWIVRGDGHVRA